MTEPTCAPDVVANDQLERDSRIAPGVARRPSVPEPPRGEAVPTVTLRVTPRPMAAPRSGRAASSLLAGASGPHSSRHVATCRLPSGGAGLSGPVRRLTPSLRGSKDLPAPHRSHVRGGTMQEGRSRVFSQAMSV